MDCSRVSWGARPGERERDGPQVSRSSWSLKTVSAELQCKAPTETSACHGERSLPALPPLQTYIAP